MFAIIESDKQKVTEETLKVGSKIDKRLGH